MPTLNFSEGYITETGQAALAEIMKNGVDSVSMGAGYMNSINKDLTDADLLTTMYVDNGSPTSDNFELHTPRTVRQYTSLEGVSGARLRAYANLETLTTTQEVFNVFALYATPNGGTETLLSVYKCASDLTLLPGDRMIIFLFIDIGVDS